MSNDIIKLSGALTAEDITKLMATTRDRNQYGPQLLDFMNNSDQAGISILATWPNLYQHKELTTVYQGFINAAKKAKIEDKVKVLKRDEDIFLIHKERATILIAKQDEDNNEENGNDNEENENENPTEE